jgi:transposase
MAGKLLPDELWNEIAHLFPQHVQSPEGGRHPKEHRVVLTAILFVLKTGIGWEDLPLEAFACSYKTCNRRLREWTELGIWQQIHQLFLAKLRGADQLDWSRVLIDCSQVKAPLGGQKQGRIRPIAAARAVSIAC